MDTKFEFKPSGGSVAYPNPEKLDALVGDVLMKPRCGEGAAKGVPAHFTTGVAKSGLRRIGDSDFPDIQAHREQLQASLRDIKAGKHKARTTSDDENELPG